MLEEGGFRVEAAYLFGSYARGDWLYSSDIDLVVVSKDFEKLRWLDRLGLIAKIQLRLGLEKWVEALPYTPKEFAEALERSAVLKDASKYWVRVR
ncbi:MAG: nucleotidyltransferase domain-containing protein [Pyrobaculum sp.]